MPRPVEWLWWPYIPFGKITAVAGQMGQAKSLFTVRLASAATTGHGVNTTPGGVIMLSAEDDAEDTIRPRLEAAGADLDRVWIEPGADLDPKRLAAICAELDGTVLVTIDPVTAYFPGTVNSWKAQDVRRTLEPIRSWPPNGRSPSCSSNTSTAGPTPPSRCRASPTRRASPSLPAPS